MQINPTLVLAVIAGSFCVYCGQVAMHGTPVPDARGDSGSGCCSPTAPTFTKLADASLAAGASSPPIAVGAYRQIVVYITSGPIGVTGGCDLAASFRPDANTAFGDTAQVATFGGLLRVDGSDLQLTSPCTDAYHYVVAGVQ